MSTEITGGLIQMTAHQVLTGDANTLIWFGTAMAVIFAFLAIFAAVSGKRKHKRRYVLGFLALAVVGVALVIGGARLPMKKVLYCCADGPVDLQMVATRYDIVDVDGKLLTLMER